MTKKDKELIDKANKTHWSDWDIVDDMIKLADTDECKRELRNIAMYLYRKDEFYAGML